MTDERVTLHQADMDKAKQIVGEWIGTKYSGSAESWAALQRFVVVAIAEERERCAKVAEDFHRDCDCKEMISDKIREGK